MRRQRHCTGLVVGLVALAAAGCGDDGVTPPEGPNPHVVVTGKVTQIENSVPVDGGVEIDIVRADGTPEVLYLPSFGWQEPSPNELAAFQVVLELEVGNIVTAQGERTEFGIKIEGLRIVRR